MRKAGNHDGVGSFAEDAYSPDEIKRESDGKGGWKREGKGGAGVFAPGILVSKRTGEG